MHATRSAPRPRGSSRPDPRRVARAGHRHRAARRDLTHAASPAPGTGRPIGVRLLAIHLQDHLAGSTVGLELARRTAGANRGSEFGAPLADLRDEVAEDRLTLLDVMRRLDVAPDRLKVAAAWAAEKAGRLKLNGQLHGYSPLSRVIELEGLAMGVSGKRKLWDLLRRMPADVRLAGIDFAQLVARADDQLARIEELHGRATAVAFGATPS
jgi:hypothetical protein